MTTAAFDTFESGGGVAWLVPTGSTAFVFSGGGFARTSRFGWEPGAAGTLFWGSRSFNFHSAYAVGVGLFAQGRYGLGDGKQADAIVGVQLDLEYLALPFVLVYQAARALTRSGRDARAASVELERVAGSDGCVTFGRPWRRARCSSRSVARATRSSARPMRKSCSAWPRP